MDKKIIIIVIICYLALINIIGALSMIIDKRRAIKGKYRISEACLLSFSIAGGGIGSIIAMYTVRHKTKHKKFTVLMPILTVIFYIALIAILVFTLGGVKL